MFEVRPGYKSKDSKRQNADVSNAANAYTHQYLPVVVLLSTQIDYVVGNSKFYDVLLPTEEIYASLFSSVKLSPVSIERIRKRTSKKELFEFVVHAKKT